jgi:hypothetical protein
MSAVKLLSLKWTPHRDEWLKLFIAGMDSYKLGQILPSRSALQLTVEQKPERTD